MSVFSGELTKKIESYLGRYETKRSAIIPVLHVVQDEFGYIGEEHVEELHNKFDLHRVQVQEVLTFYSIFRDEKPRKFQVRFCDNMACMMMGSRPAMAKIEERIAAYKAKGEEPPFSIEHWSCLGVCDGAPAMLVNKDRHLCVNADNVDDVLDKYAPRP